MPAVPGESSSPAADPQRHEPRLVSVATMAGDPRGADLKRFLQDDAGDGGTPGYGAVTHVRTRALTAAVLQPTTAW